MGWYFPLFNQGVNICLPHYCLRRSCISEVKYHRIAHDRSKGVSKQNKGFHINHAKIIRKKKNSELLWEFPLGLNGRMCLTGQIPRINATEICIKKPNNQHLEVEKTLKRSVLRNCFHNSFHMNALPKLLHSQRLLFLRSLFCAFWSFFRMFNFWWTLENIICSLTKWGRHLFGFPRRKAFCFMCCC